VITAFALASCTAYADQSAQYRRGLDLRVDVGVDGDGPVDIHAARYEGFPELIPAATDPVLGKKKLPADYLTTAPNSRKFFYYLPNANPATLAADERSKTTTTAAEVPGFAQELVSQAFAKAVRVPILVVVGDHDYLYQGDDPAAFKPDQKNAFEAAVSVEAVLIPNAAHDPALHRNAGFTTALINQWASSALAQGPSRH
jgi:pimeloyl-ACP methyl ester carboxylesterase